MIRQHVSSSNLSSVGYDPSSRTLEIAFIGGGVYQYSGVPSSVYQALMSASSKGGYFARAIKNRYSTRKVG
ncbi:MULTISPECIES: KTSC domain-containing protein [Serratia]|uniref:KTSC domain-containing protein n=1 Tax=Serratia TaxID=613 RepID=UPI0009306391|nr:KTSC domain-containing protein [Serratia marcescens]POX30664.1 KTSC domain-containing protein [Serratia marcescens]HBH7559728.1 KTSC domain-containing protein [Serratia marcescens]